MGMPHFHITLFALTRSDGLFVQSFNSLGQDACLIVAYMMSTCNGGCESFTFYSCLATAESQRFISFPAFTVPTLVPGYSYTGPSGPDNSNLCKCSTIAYSLISACGGCQGAKWITYGSHSLLDSWGLYVYRQLVAIRGQLHEDFASRLVGCLHGWERVAFDTDAVPQVPQPYPRRNTSPPVGSPRRHGSLLKLSSLFAYSEHAPE